MRWSVLFLLWSAISFAEPDTFDRDPAPIARAKGFKLDKGWSKGLEFKPVLKAIALPRHFDWREQGTLTPIRDQGNCGSCWAHSTTAVLQDLIALKNKTIVSLSPQYLVSCNKKNWGCDGGDFAHDMHVKPGAVLESDYPYTAKDSSCKSGLQYPYKLSSWAFVPSKSEDDVPAIEDIKAAIYQHGPIAAAVAANDAMESYKSGVFNKCDNTEVNHAIELIGWDDDGQYFIMRNSWGTSWGLKGFGYIRYGCNKIGIASNYVVYSGGAPAPSPNPVPQPTPTPPPVPKCTPQPYANAGNNYRVFPGQWVVLGTMAQPQTAYVWDINGRVNTKFNTARIRAQVFSDAIFTVYATTKCGTARSAAMVIVQRRR